ncbi:hypothetical protein TanjilG_07496 [Lupinus angustifolius]|uniref:Uncharacterized protein n=1 Tax=Lupinus angustifolius TaxID=3871 RepID=A0A4P1QUZ6_LUPAN|nr:hypothetical protein TanjilG_07496 [Lupinus angustifolius]
MHEIWNLEWHKTSVSLPPTFYFKMALVIPQSAVVILTLKVERALVENYPSEYVTVVDITPRPVLALPSIPMLNECDRKEQYSTTEGKSSGGEPPLPVSVGKNLSLDGT